MKLTKTFSSSTGSHRDFIANTQLVFMYIFKLDILQALDKTGKKNSIQITQTHALCRGFKLISFNFLNF